MRKQYRNEIAVILDKLRMTELKNPMKYDVIIAGAGPTGSMAALVLSSAGKRVLVLEKAQFPRPKVCGDSLNPRTWAVWQRHGLAERYRALPHFDVAGFTLETEGVPVIRHRFGAHRTRAVDRAVLDAWLAEEAQAAGADYRFGVAVQSLTATDVTTSAGNFEAPHVIGADGRNSIVGRLSNLARPARPANRVGWQTFITAPFLDDHVHMNVFREGYYGITRIDENRATISMVLQAQAKVTPEEIVARYLPNVGETTWRSLSPVTRPPWQLTDGRTWLAGDAARILEPLTGEGIYSALATGEMVAEHLLSIDRVGVRRAMQNYQRQHRRFYGSRTYVNSLVRWMLSDPRRSLALLRVLKFWPTAVSRMVEWVQKPESVAATSRVPSTQSQAG